MDRSETRNSAANGAPPSAREAWPSDDSVTPLRSPLSAYVGSENGDTGTLSDLVGIQITHETRCKHVCSATITRRYGPIHRTTGTVQSTSTRQCYRTSGTSRGEQRTCQTHRLQLPSTARILCVPHSTCLPSERLQQAPGGACGHASTHGHVAHAGSGLPGPWRRPCHRFQHSAWKFIGRVFDGS